MSFTWLVLFVVIGLTGAWWWQNHKAQQEEITTMADQSSAELNQSGNDNAQSVPLNTEGAATSSEPQTAATDAPATDAGRHPPQRLIPLRLRLRIQTRWLPLLRQTWIPRPTRQRPPACGQRCCVTANQPGRNGCASGGPKCAGDELLC